MSKKKTSKKPVHRRKHHKVGAIKEGSMEYYLLFGVGAVAGGVASAYIVQALQTAMGTSTPLSVGPGIVTAGGLGVALLGKGNPIALGAGGGMAAVGGSMLLNETFLNVPGLSGPPAAFRSNASPGATVVRQAVGTAKANTMNRVGMGPNAYVNQTVGTTRKMMRLGTLASN
jgi:hypothetical protein